MKGEATDILTAKETQCYHCGLSCNEGEITTDDKDFCCEGCKTVYEILKDNDLCNYYDLQNSPGKTIFTIQTDKFQYLENPEIQNKLLDYSSAELNKISFNIPAIHCSSCIWLLENLDRLVEGIITSRVNFPGKSVRVDYDPSIISMRKIADILASVGYEPEINLQQTETRKRKKDHRNEYVKLGIVGFAFGNIMLFSFPEYLGLDKVDAYFQEFFSYIIAILSVPVLIIGGGDYFRSAIKGFRQQQVNIDVPIALGILALFIRSSWEILSQTGQGYFDSMAGLIFFLMIGKWFQGKTYENLSYERDYKSYFPLAVTRLVNGKKESILGTELNVGDRIVVRNKELIPADSELISGNASVDYSFVTGESTPVDKNQGDYIYAGGRQMGSSVEMEVRKEVSQSYLTQLWDNEIFSKQDDSATQSLINGISRYFTIVVVSIAVVSALIWSFSDFGKAINVFSAVLIVACPCALALATPFTLGNTIRLFGRNRFYLKNAHVIERINKVNTIVFDKTGTITVNSENSVVAKGDFSHDDLVKIRSLLSHSTHPLSRAVLSKLIDDTGNMEYEVEEFKEIEGSGISGTLGGSKLKAGSSDFTGHKASEGNVNASRVYVNIDNLPAGYFEVRNTYREGTEEMIGSIPPEIGLKLVSGDNRSEEASLKKMFPASTELHFGQSPYDKMEYIEGLQKTDHKVMMLGDGLNDAGALKQSDLGIAVTDDITAFTPSSDAILAGDRMIQLPKFLKMAAISRKVIIASIVISFLYNVAGLSFAVSGNLTPVFAAILMPISSISVVIFTTVAVNWWGRILKLS